MRVFNNSFPQSGQRSLPLSSFGTNWNVDFTESNFRTHFRKFVKEQSMKKKISAIILILAVIVSVCTICYQMPVDMMNLDAEEVCEIRIFNGNNGQEIQITDRQAITHIIENLGGVQLKRSGLSLGYMGYSFRITIYLSNGKKARGWNEFVLNSSDSIRKDPFFYKVVKGNIDYEFISQQFSR